MDAQDKTVKDPIDALCEAFLSLSDVAECRAFFADLLTSKEVEDLSMRLEVARLLRCGTNYIDIAAKTSASTATISRVSKCLNGSAGGYRMVLNRSQEGGTDSGIVRVDTLSEEEAEAVRRVVACLKNKKA